MADKRKYNRKSAAELRAMVAERDDVIETQAAELKQLKDKMQKSLPQTEAYTVMQWDCPNCLEANVEADSIEDGEAYVCGECGESVVLNVQ